MLREVVVIGMIIIGVVKYCVILEEIKFIIVVVEEVVEVLEVYIIIFLIKGI